MHSLDAALPHKRPYRSRRHLQFSYRVVNGILECPPQEDPHPYRDLPGGFSKHLEDALFPPWIIRRGSMTAWEARIVGEEWAREWGRWCAATRAPETPAQRYAAVPLEGWGPDTRPRPTVIRGAGPDHPWDAATGEWLQAAPGPQTGWTGDVSSLVRTPVPPRIVLHAANVLRATEIRKWGPNTATVRRHTPEDGATQLAVAHFKTGGPVYDDTLSWLGNTQGPLLLMLPTDLAAALRQELDGCKGLRVGWEAVADGTLLALLHRDAANGCQWDTLAPHLTGRHVYMATPPEGHPRPAWEDLIAGVQAEHPHKHTHGPTPQPGVAGRSQNPSRSTNTDAAHPSQEWRGASGARAQADRNPDTPARSGGAQPDPEPNHTHPHRTPQPGVAGYKRSAHTSAHTPKHPSQEWRGAAET